MDNARRPGHSPIRVQSKSPKSIGTDHLVRSMNRSNSRAYLLSAGGCDSDCIQLPFTSERFCTCPALDLLGPLPNPLKALPLVWYEDISEGLRKKNTDLLRRGFSTVQYLHHKVTFCGATRHSSETAGEIHREVHSPPCVISRWLTGNLQTCVPLTLL